MKDRYATSGYVTDDPTELVYYDPPSPPTSEGFWELVGTSVCFTPYDNYKFMVIQTWNWKDK